MTAIALPPRDFGPRTEATGAALPLALAAKRAALSVTHPTGPIETPEEALARTLRDLTSYDPKVRARARVTARVAGQRLRDAMLADKRFLRIDEEVD